MTIFLNIGEPPTPAGKAVIPDKLELLILALGTVPEDKLLAFKEVKLAPLVAGNVAGNLASGKVPEVKFVAFKFVKSIVPYSNAVAPEFSISKRVSSAPC